MICIARTFGAPTSVPAGKAGRKQIERIAPGGKLALHAADDVHHVTVALNGTIGIHAHAAGARDPAQIVACQINQHHVLGIFLGIGQQLGLELRIACRLGMARARTGNRPQLRAGRR